MNIFGFGNSKVVKNHTEHLDSDALLTGHL